MQEIPVTCILGSECMNRISHDNPGEGAKINHVMQWLDFQIVSLKAENTPCVSNPSSSRSVGDGDGTGTGDIQS